METMKRQFRLIVFDLPPIATHASCMSVASTLDGVVLVIEAEKVRGQVAVRACEQLARAKVAVLGVVLNKRRLHVPEWLYRRL
jgi:Mrp family chromosome partitioning ATPase